MTTPTTLDVSGLTVRIPLRRGGTVHAVTDAYLTASAGRLHFLVGGSGSGKSTLMSTITGLLPRSAVVSGNVSVTDESGTVLTGPELWQRRGRTVGVVPQSAMTCFTPVRRLGPQLAETARYARGERSPAELLDLVELDRSALRRYPHELSGGMAQRAAIAAALAGDPQVIIADEPTSALDPELSTSVVSLLSDLAGTGRIVIAATHDLACITGDTADISVMCASRVVESGPARRVLDRPRHEYTRDLLAALPENGLTPLPHPLPDLVDLPDDYRYGDTIV
ncbi:ATP-binding cassette domain-containing protein [Tsukamurella sp. 8F]|uniref:ATP-binding cassette domain-containing protein n=1 Tax=unclassified Tsukamurella TaxID=2633480 RepID=UPI0023B8BB2D|nr:MULTISPECIES: ATP-binding cassette domain-containing protein [unclassified Tsukamurella]MDF0531940.1 ATP-binding cassette domain-containing protein [Tsukamurella sp. 8J]MDF0588009.1 ATP-binding cassette domain-containing protein [Tsukamurella sp. 8F]